MSSPQTEPKVLSASFYRAINGLEPVRLWLKGMSRDERRLVSEDIETVALGWVIGVPDYRLVAPRRGLWEIRRSLGGDRMARVLICRCGEQVILLHAFFRTDGETPDTHLDLAVKRQQEMGLGSHEGQ